ncbi:unnamed protein product [Ascophyllum nodosum]
MRGIITSASSKLGWSSGAYSCSRASSITRASQPRRDAALAASWGETRGGGGQSGRQRALRLAPLQAEAEGVPVGLGIGIQGEAVTGESSESSAPKPQVSLDTVVIVEQEEGNSTSSGTHEDARSPRRRFWGKTGARFFGAGTKMPNLKQLGLYAVLSYGFVSNVSYGVCVSLAWFTTCKKTGLSPLAPGQRQAFLVSYAAFFAINNILRVPRFALAMSLAPAFDRFIALLMRTTRRGKTFATVLCVILVNILGTFAVLGTGIMLASLVSGVPLWPAA